MTPTTSLLAEVRLLRRMGENGRTAAAMALRSARLGRRPEPSGSTPGIAASTASTEDDDALKFMIHELDNAVVQRGGRSIFAAKPVGTLSAEAERRLEAWVFETPRRHANATGPEPNDRPAIAPRVTSDKPGRIAGLLSGWVRGTDGDGR